MSQYIRFKQYPVPFVLSRIQGGIQEEILGEEEGQPVYGRYMGKRLRVFAVKGIRCVKCDLEGVFFALERDKMQGIKDYHFNLYGLRGQSEVLMTRDHIHPISKGGSDEMRNQQPMCARCNRRKSDKITKGSSVDLLGGTHRRQYNKAIEWIKRHSNDQRCVMLIAHMFGIDPKEVARSVLND